MLSSLKAHHCCLQLPLAPILMSLELPLLLRRRLQGTQAVTTVHTQAHGRNTLSQ